MEVLSEYSGYIMIPVTDIYRYYYDMATRTFGSRPVEMAHYGSKVHSMVSKIKQWRMFSC